MEAKGVFTAGSQALLANDARARDIMERLQVGDRVLVRVHKARNPEHHRLAFAVFSRIADATGKPVRTILNTLLFYSGHWDWQVLPNGARFPVLDSLKFESMSQDEFQAFWESSWDIIAREFLPGIPEKDFEEIRAIVADDSSSRRPPTPREEKAARSCGLPGDRAATLVPAEGAQ